MISVCLHQEGGVIACPTNLGLRPPGNCSRFRCWKHPIGLETLKSIGTFRSISAKRSAQLFATGRLTVFWTKDGGQSRFCLVAPSLGANECRHLLTDQRTIISLVLSQGNSPGVEIDKDDLGWDRHERLELAWQTDDVWSWVFHDQWSITLDISSVLVT